MLSPYPFLEIFESFEDAWSCYTTENLTWAKKLQGVYATQSKEIQDAYPSIATGQ